VFGSDLEAGCQTYDTSWLKKCHGLALMGNQMLLGHYNIIHWIHMNDMESLA
jgi:hypothetical protein